VHVLIETTVAVSKKLVGHKGDNIIKTLTNVLKTQAAAMESGLAALRQELVKAQEGAKKSEHTVNCNKSKEIGIEQGDTIARLSLDDNTVQIEMQAEPCEQYEEQIPPVSTEEKATTSMETDAAEADAAEADAAEANEQADIGVEQEQPQPLTAEAQTSALADIWQQEVEAATFPNATDKIVFTRALSDMVSQDATLRADAAKALAGIRHELSVRALAGQMGREQSEQVRQECIRGLTKLEMKEGLAAVESALTDQVAQVRLVAVWSLYLLAGVEAVPALIRMFSDENEQVRRRAITCIGWLAQGQAAVDTVGNRHSQQVVSALVGRLDDPEKSIRTAALGVLETVTGKKISDQLPPDEDSHQDIIARWKKWWTQELLA
ncbi:MAG: HEAT repeat domain-containing protein, partial [Planctomycetota bacterium]